MSRPRSLSCIHDLENKLVWSLACLSSPQGMRAIRVRRALIPRLFGEDIERLTTIWVDRGVELHEGADILRDGIRVRRRHRLNTAHTVWMKGPDMRLILSIGRSDVIASAINGRILMADGAIGIWHPYGLISWRKYFCLLRCPC